MLAEWEIDAARRAAADRRRQEAAKAAEAARAKAFQQEWNRKRAAAQRRAQLEELSLDPVLRRADDHLLLLEVGRHIALAEQLVAEGRPVPPQLKRSIYRDLAYLKGDQEQAAPLALRVEQR